MTSSRSCSPVTIYQDPNPPFTYRYTPVAPVNCTIGTGQLPRGLAPGQNFEIDFDVSNNLTGRIVFNFQVIQVTFQPIVSTVGKFAFRLLLWVHCLSTVAAFVRSSSDTRIEEPSLSTVD